MAAIGEKYLGKLNDSGNVHCKEARLALSYRWYTTKLRMNIKLSYQASSIKMSYLRKAPMQWVVAVRS